MRFPLVLTALVFLGFSCATASSSRDSIRRPAAQYRKQSLVVPYEPKTEGPIPVALFDADSTLRVSPKGSAVKKYTPQEPEDVLVLPCVAERLKQVADDGYFIAIVSNQNIEEGETSLDTAEGALATTVRVIIERGGVVNYFDFAEAKQIKKPNPDLVTARIEPYLRRHFNRQIDWDRSFMVGDAGFSGKDCVHKDPVTNEEVRTPDSCPSDGRTHKHFANTDRLFAENLFRKYLPFKPWQQHYYEPSIFFGWRQMADIDVFDAPDQVNAFVAAHPDACRVVTKDWKPLRVGN